MNTSVITPIVHSNTSGNEFDLTNEQVKYLLKNVAQDCVREIMLFMCEPLFVLRMRKCLWFRALMRGSRIRYYHDVIITSMDDAKNQDLSDAAMPTIPSVTASSTSADTLLIQISRLVVDCSRIYVKTMWIRVHHQLQFQTDVGIRVHRIGVEHVAMLGPLIPMVLNHIEPRVNKDGTPNKNHKYISFDDLDRYMREREYDRGMNCVNIERRNLPGALFYHANDMLKWMALCLFMRKGLSDEYNGLVAQLQDPLNSAAGDFTSVPFVPYGRTGHGEDQYLDPEVRSVFEFGDARQN